MKFAICNEIFQGWSLYRTFAYVRQTGYDGVEIAPFTLAPSVTDIPPDRRREIRELAARHELAISGIHWVLVQTEGLHLTHPDPAVRRRTADYFRHLVDFCADLGGRFIVVGSPKQRNILEGVSPEQAPIAGEPVIDKPGKGAFYDTDLLGILRNRSIKTLIVCGVTTEVCVHTTVREANDRGFNALVPEDCTASYFPEFKRVALEMVKAQGGIFGWVSNSDKVIKGLEDAAKK